MPDAVTVDALHSGDHACLTFSDPDERLDLLAAFVSDGLLAGHKVLCWTDAISPDELSAELSDRAAKIREALDSGQLGVEAAAQTLLGGGPPVAQTMLGILADQVDLAGREGYPVLRVTTDMGWATRPLAAADELVSFERKLAGLVPPGRLCMICEYDRERFDAVTLAFAAKAHDKTVAALAYHDDPLLRICRQYSPPGVRIAGELDYRHLPELDTALAEAVRLDDQLFVNLARLDYIDAASASAIVRTALGLPAERRMTVICHGLVARMLVLVGAEAAEQLHQRRPHG
ncbi:MAG: hypothetical protein HOV79_16685 [Hamadaea sp.]|nr:hypothetical protein [Hamadaea sp.]